MLCGDDPTADLCVTYWMNALQPSLGSEHDLFVTLNPARPPRADLVLGRYSYDHPQFDNAAIAAQADLPGIQGVRRTSGSAARGRAMASMRTG